jgi:serine/threonine protein kinase
MAQTTHDNIFEVFDLLIPLGSGSKGQVWLARSPAYLAGPVVLKLLQPSSRASLEEGGRRWELLGDHPDIVRVLDARWTGAQPFVAMEYIDGPSLRVLLEQSREQYIPLSISMHIMRGVLHALAYAHSISPEPVVHGGLNPDSVLIQSSTGTAKVDDFCLGPTDGIPDTVRGHAMDHLRHLAPEQLAGKTPTPQADIYAAGIMLHELLFGCGPFENLPMLSLLSPNTRATVFAGDLPPGTPVGLLGVLRRALASDPADRFSSAREMLQALQPDMPTWEEGSHQVAEYTQHLARHASSAMDSVPPPELAVPAWESDWEPSIEGGDVDSDPTDPFNTVTAVAWTSTHRLAEMCSEPNASGPEGAKP